MEIGRRRKQQRWKIIASTVRFDGFTEKAGKENREYKESSVTGMEN